MAVNRTDPPNVIVEETTKVVLPPNPSKTPRGNRNKRVLTTRKKKKTQKNKKSKPQYNPTAFNNDARVVHKNFRFSDIIANETFDFTFGGEEGPSPKMGQTLLCYPICPRGFPETQFQRESDFWTSFRPKSFTLHVKTGLKADGMGEYLLYFSEQEPELNADPLSHVRDAYSRKLKKTMPLSSGKLTIPFPRNLNFRNTSDSTATLLDEAFGYVSMIVINPAISSNAQIQNSGKPLRVNLQVSMSIDVDFSGRRYISEKEPVHETGSFDERIFLTSVTGVNVELKDEKTVAPLLAKSQPGGSIVSFNSDIKFPGAIFKLINSVQWKVNCSKTNKFLRDIPVNYLVITDFPEVVYRYSQTCFFFSEFSGAEAFANKEKLAATDSSVEKYRDMLKTLDDPTSKVIDEASRLFYLKSGVPLFYCEESSYLFPANARWQLTNSPVNEISDMKSQIQNLQLAVDRLKCRKESDSEVEVSEKESIPVRSEST